MGERLIEVEFVDSKTNKSYLTYLSPADVKRAETDKEFSQSILNGLINSNMKVGNASTESDTLFIDVFDDKTEVPNTTESIEIHGMWSHEQILCLIDAYSKVHQQTDGGKKLVRNLWAQVAQEMLKHGYDIASTKCSIKFDALKRRYRKVLIKNQETGNDHSNFKYFHQFDAIFNNQAGGTEVQHELNLSNEHQATDFSDSSSINVVYARQLDEYDESLSHDIETLATSDYEEKQSGDCEERLSQEFEDVQMDNNEETPTNSPRLYSKRKTGSSEDIYDENSKDELSTTGNSFKRQKVEVTEDYAEGSIDEQISQDQSIRNVKSQGEYLSEEEEEEDEYYDEQSTRENRPKQRQSHRLHLLEKLLEEKRLKRKLREEYSQKKLILFEKLLKCLTNNES